MKVLISMACAVATGLAMAREWHVDGLSATALADTEVTTNCPIALDSCFLRNIRFSLDFIATPSNNVQAAFGRDADGDGVLAVGETDLVVGWECGRWFLMGPDLTTGLSAEAVTTAADKRMSWDLRMVRRHPKQLTLTENGVVISADPVEGTEPWLFDRGWNLVRLTARGVDNPAAAFCLTADEQGVVFIFR